MDNQVAGKFLDIINQNSKLTIAVGKNASYDDMASALSLYLGLKQLDKDTIVVSATTPLVEHSSLVGIDNVKNQLSGEGGDLIVAFPYKDGEIDKVSYTLENGFLNIIVKEGPLGIGFDEKSVKYTRSGGIPQVLIIVGTPNLTDLGSLFNADALKDTVLINIDNKQNNQGFGDVVIVNPGSSAVSEIMAKLLIQLGVNIDSDIAQNLLNGITYATNNFQNPNTSFDAFEIATNMMRAGAVRKPVSQPRPQPQNEERVSSFMPEQMLSTMPRPGGQQQYSPRTTQMPSQRMPRYAPRVQRYPTRPMPNQPGQQQYAESQNLTQEVQDQAPQQMSQRSVQQQPAPSDWLEPKVYKGSSDVQ